MPNSGQNRGGLAGHHRADGFGKGAPLLDLAGRSKASVRLDLDGSRLWIGPDFAKQDSGCNTCFERRLRLNRPEHQNWGELSPKVQASSTSSFPLTGAMVAIADLLATEVEANDGERGLFFIFDLAKATVSRHRFFRDPECPACSALVDDCAEGATLALLARTKAEPRSYRLPNPQLTPAAAESVFVDPRAGLVKHVFVDMNSRLMPMAGAEMSVPEHGQTSLGYGRTDSIATSRMVAVLECAERYASTIPRAKRTAVRGSYSQLADRAIDPRSFTLHAARQAQEQGYNLIPYSDDLEQDWVWAHSMRRGEAALMPEQLAYYGVADRPEKPVNRYVQETSSGCALGGSLEEAILFGLCEVIERDAYMVGWYGRFHYPKLDPGDAADPVIHHLLSRAEAQGYRVHLFDATLEARVPTIWAMIEDERPGAPVRSYCAASAHCDPEKAIVSALVEVISSIGVYSQSMPARRDHARALVADPSLVQRMDDHVLLYSQAETMAWLEFLPRHGDPEPLRERFREWYEAEPAINLTAELQAIANRVLAVAKDILIVDQTFPQMDALKLKAVRVSVPGLLPVSFGHQFRRVNLERVRQAARFLGQNANLMEADLNPIPHNFP